MAHRKGFQYGPLTVVVERREGSPLWDFSVSDRSGHAFTGAINPADQVPLLVAREIMWALRYLQGVMAEGGQPSASIAHYFPGMRLQDFYAAAEAFGEQVDEATEVIQQIDEDVEIDLGGGRQKVECRFKCPGGTIPSELSIWPRKGETANEACRRYLRERYGVDDYQFSLCEKIQVRYID